jgi:hypothetical protein
MDAQGILGVDDLKQQLSLLRLIRNVFLEDTL